MEDCRVSVANQSRLRLISESGTKDDRNDARVLGDLLRTNYLPMAHMSDEETREKLFVVNDRVTYGLRRSELRGTIRWLLKRRGIEVESPFSDEGRKKPRELRLREIEIGLDELELVESTIGKLDAQILDIVSRMWEEQRVFDFEEGLAQAIVGSAAVVTALDLTLAASLGSLGLVPFGYMEQVGISFVISLVLDTSVMRESAFPRCCSCSRESKASHEGPGGRNK